MCVCVNDLFRVKKKRQESNSQPHHHNSQFPHHNHYISTPRVSVRSVCDLVLTIVSALQSKLATPKYNSRLRTPLSTQCLLGNKNGGTIARNDGTGNMADVRTQPQSNQTADLRFLTPSPSLLLRRTPIRHGLRP